MGSHVNLATGVLFSVDDIKDDRYTSGQYKAEAKPAGKPASKAPAKAQK